MNSNSARKAKILLVTPHKEPSVIKLQELVGGEKELEIFVSNPVKVQGNKRNFINKIKYYWIDPIYTLFKLLPLIKRYDHVICYYHRTGYWMGIYKLLFPKRKPFTSTWIGFAPNPKPSGLSGWIKETITATSLRGHTKIICNAKPLISAIKKRFTLPAEKLEFVRWGGSAMRNLNQQAIIKNSDSRGYLFTGGRTNRDFDTVLTAASVINYPTVLVVDKGYKFKKKVPDNVTVYVSISSDEFQRLLIGAKIVIIALEKHDISSGQVVLHRSMSSGKPTLVSKMAGMDDYAEDGKDVIFFDPHNSDDLISKIKMLLNDEILRRKLSLASYERAKRFFNSNNFANDMHKVLLDVFKL